MGIAGIILCTSSASTMALFGGKYRVESARLPAFGYGEGWYHVVVCTRDRIPFFGQVKNGVMGLSELGLIAHRHCAKLDAKHPGVRTEAFVVMPNHVHLLIGILDAAVAPGADAEAPLQFGPHPKNSLPAIVRAYKAVVTHEARSTGHSTFAWQSRYYDRVVRAELALQAMIEYISDNPSNWSKDQHHTDR
jgi:putative transposase